jgi:hypothetical protein
MNQDTGTAASEDVTTKTSAAADAPPAAADAAPAGDTAKPKADSGSDSEAPADLGDAYGISRKKLGPFIKLVRSALALADMRSSYGLLQAAAFLIDEACDVSNHSHAEGLQIVVELLQRVQAKRDEAEESVASMLEQLQAALLRSRKSKESAQG